MRVYWAGAAFWLEADLALRRERGSSLDEVLSRYSSCCLRGTGEVAPADFIDALDQIAGGGIFHRLYERYAASREFPSLHEAYRALGIASGSGGLTFSARPEAAALRKAIMATRPRR
jgi:predicted metalloprotease with PDZ domain